MRAIDMHVHPPRRPELPESPIEGSLRRFFKMAEPPEDVAAMAKRYEELDIVGVLLTIDSETTTGDKPDGNDYTAEIVANYPGRFIGFASVDPHKGDGAVTELERALGELKLSGLKLHPIQQNFTPNERRFYPLYETCVARGVPVIFHSGFGASGAGMPGGAGLTLEQACPIPWADEVAANFPGLTIVLAHPSWPWVEHQIAVALHKPNVFIDLSGWLPRYIPEVLWREVNTRLREKAMFGSDYPYITPERWLQDLSRSVEIRDGVMDLLMTENAKRVLGLGAR
jgi:predicted TIM-barrel fold metal-dependent hydrolase